jgi:hypothetical protein
VKVFKNRVRGEYVEVRGRSVLQLKRMKWKALRKSGCKCERFIKLDLKMQRVDRIHLAYYSAY